MFFKRIHKELIKEDEELLTLYKDSGDLSYLGELYERYIHLVLGISMKYLKNQEESKDMTMQVFEKVAEVAKLNEVKNFKSWLHVVTKNECLMLLRSKKYQLNKNAQEFKSDNNMERAYFLHHDEEGTLENSLQDLEEAITVLPSEQQECIKKFYLEDKCYKSIAEETGYEIKKVKSYIQNGKRNLRIHMQKSDG
jgi:RNA polymerase sigma-70 factor (ECF subfamily)